MPTLGSHPDTLDFMSLRGSLDSSNFRDTLEILTNDGDLEPLVHMTLKELLGTLMTGHLHGLRNNA